MTRRTAAYTRKSIAVIADVVRCRTTIITKSSSGIRPVSVTILLR